MPMVVFPTQDAGENNLNQEDGNIISLFKKLCLILIGFLFASTINAYDVVPKIKNSIGEHYHYFSKDGSELHIVWREKYAFPLQKNDEILFHTTTFE